MARLWAGTLSILILVPACAGAARAETPAIEEVVVTATKRAEPLREVPMAVTALTGDQLARLQAMDFADFVNSVPGMTYSSSDPGHTQLILRGINAGGVGATIGVYLDETPYGSSSALANGTITTPNLDTFDIERVEVLKGPQGTLYGSSTLGGLLKFVTNPPDPSGFDDRFEVGGTDVDHGGAGWLLKGMINVPLADDLAFRAVAYGVRDGGFIDDPVLGDNNVNSVSNDGGRASLLWAPISRLSIRATALMQNLDSNSSFDMDMTPAAGTGDLTFKPLFGDLEQGRLANEFSDVRYRLYNVTGNYDFGWAQLVSATSYGTFDDHILTDGTNIFGLFVTQHLGQKKFTQEIRLASPGGQQIEWLAGLYYTHETANLLQDLVLTPDSPPLGSLTLTSSYAEIAGFGDVTYHFSPQWDLSVGGRFSHNSQSANETGLALASGASNGNVFTWSAAPRWHPTDDTMVYARIAKGFRPGGPNALPPDTQGVPTEYSADSLINYELGAKSDLLNGALSLDADVFYIDWSNIQLLTIIQNFGVNGNGGSAKSEGFEWNATWLPIENLTLHFGGAFTDAELTSNTGPLVGGVSGDWLPYAPRWSTSLDADYNFLPIGDFTPFAGASWNFIGERRSAFDPVHGQVLLPSYNTVDLRVGVQREAWSLELYVKNIGDARGITAVDRTASAAAAAAAGVPFGGTVPSVAVITPRLFGITLTGKI